MRIKRLLFSICDTNELFRVNACLFPCIVLCILTMSSCLASKKNSGIQKVTGSTSGTIVETTPTTIQQDTLIWRDTLKSGQNEMVIICFTKIGSSIKADTVDYIQIVPTTDYASLQIDSSYIHKRRYRIAVILPFMSRSFTPSPTKEIPASSLKAVELYEGISMAIDSLQYKLSMQVDVFDSMRDTQVIRKLINSDTLLNVDAIIGPVTSQNVRMLAQYAKDNKIYLISPLNSRDDLTEDNPFYIQVNPSFISREISIKFSSKNKLPHSKKNTFSLVVHRIQLD